jgi:hypothetical protein
VNPTFRHDHSQGRARQTLLAFSLLGLASIAAAGSAQAATYFVRADGGDASQCTGRSDAAYPGSGTAQACAWKHPFVALPPARTPRIAGGDTLIIGPGNYMMGIGAPDTGGCTTAWAYDCHMPPLPSGPSASQPTRILGKGHDTGCKAPPQLWGTERAYTVFNLRGSSNIEIGCFEVTDRHACIRGHGGGNACPTGGGTWARAGLIAHDSSNVRLTDLNIHGMADKGIHAGRLRDWTMTRLTLRANCWVGWDGDVGAGNSSNSGNIIFRESEIAWNGCAEKYPSTEIHACWGQQTGGYGDGLGTHQTAGHWLFEDSLIHHNTSDGLDLLYMADGGSVTIRRTWAEGNAGNQLKTKGNARIENSVVVGNCAFFEGKFNMLKGDNCRAMGNALSIGLFDTSTVDLVNNTISSQGDCLVVSHGGTSGARLNLVNNVMIGEVDWTNTSERSCVHYADKSSAVVNWDRNLVTGVKNNSCPAGSLCADARIAKRTYDAFDPTPLSGSPLIDAANGGKAPGNDYHRRSRNVPDIGAVEFGAAAGGGTPPPSDPPPATPPPSTPPPAPTPQPVVASVGAVSVSALRIGSHTYHTANAVILDAGGRALSGVMVSGRWTNAGIGTGSASTDTSGLARIDGGRTKKATRARFCVTAVSGVGISYGGGQVCSN